MPIKILTATAIAVALLATAHAAGQSADPRQLIVSSKGEGGPMPGGGRIVKRVYDAKPS